MCTCHTVVSGSTSVSRLLMFHSHLLCSLSLQNILYQKSFPDEMIDRFMATMGSRYRAGYCLAGSDLDERIPRGFLNHAHLPQSLEAATTRRIQPSKPSPTNLARFSTHDHCIKSLDLTWSPRCSLPLRECGQFEEGHEGRRCLPNCFCCDQWFPVAYLCSFVQKKGPFPQPCTCLLVPLNSDIHIYEFWTFNYIIHMSSFPSLVVLLRRITSAATGEATSLSIFP